MEFVVDLMQWLHVRKRRATAETPHWSNPDEALEFVIAALKLLRISIPQNLAPGHFRVALKRANRVLHITQANLSIPKLENVPSIPALGVDPPRNATWEWMAVSLERLTGIIDTIRTVPPPQGSIFARRLTLAANHIRRAWTYAHNRARYEHQVHQAHPELKRSLPDLPLEHALACYEEPESPAWKKLTGSAKNSSSAAAAAREPEQPRAPVGNTGCG